MHTKQTLMNLNHQQMLELLKPYQETKLKTTLYGLVENDTDSDIDVPEVATLIRDDKYISLTEFTIIRQYKEYKSEMKIVPSGMDHIQNPQDGDIIFIHDADRNPVFEWITVYNDKVYQYSEKTQLWSNYLFSKNNTSEKHKLSEYQLNTLGKDIVKLDFKDNQLILPKGEYQISFYRYRRREIDNKYNWYIVDFTTYAVDKDRFKEITQYYPDLNTNYIKDDLLHLTSYHYVADKPHGDMMFIIHFNIEEDLILDMDIFRYTTPYPVDITYFSMTPLLKSNIPYTITQVFEGINGDYSDYYQSRRVTKTHYDLLKRPIKEPCIW